MVRIVFCIKLRHLVLGVSVQRGKVLAFLRLFFFFLALATRPLGKKRIGAEAIFNMTA